MLLFIAIAGVLLLALLTATLIGAMLDPAVTEAATIELPGEQDRAIRVLSEVERYHAWLPSVNHTVPIAPLKWRENGVFGAHIVARTETFASGGATLSDLAMDPNEPSDQGARSFQRVWSVVNADGGTGAHTASTAMPTTRVHLSITRHVANPLGRFVHRYIRGEADHERKTLQALARQLGVNATALTASSS